MTARIHILLGVLASGLVASGCQTPPPEDIAETHNIIAVLPMTGPFAGKGPEHLKAIQMAIVDLERAGGLDRPVRVFVVDAANNDSALAEQRLALQLDELTIGRTRHVAAIFSSTTGAMKGTAPMALLEKIPYFEISSGSGLDELSCSATNTTRCLRPEHDRSYAFGLRPLCMPEPVVTADLFARNASTPGWQRIYIMRGSQAHDVMHTLALRESMTARGQAGRILNETDVVLPNNAPASVESQIDAAIAAGAEVIYFHLNGDGPNLEFMQAAERRGFAGKLATCGMARRQELLQPTDPGIAPYLSNNSPDQGRLYFAMRGPVESTSYNAFKKDFKAFSDFDADSFSPAAYDGMVLVGLGIAAAGTSDPAALHDTISASASRGTKYTYGELDKALAAARRGEDLDLDGASGSLDLTSDAVLGNVAVGRYYFDTVTTSAEAGKPFKYAPLEAPTEVR